MLKEKDLAELGIDSFVFEWNKEFCFVRYTKDGKKLRTEGCTTIYDVVQHLLNGPRLADTDRE